MTEFKNLTIRHPIFTMYSANQKAITVVSGPRKIFDGLHWCAKSHGNQCSSSGLTFTTIYTAESNWNDTKQCCLFQREEQLTKTCCTDIGEWGWRWLRRGCTAKRCRTNSEFTNQQFISNSQLVTGRLDVRQVLCNNVMSLSNMLNVPTSNVFPASLCVCLHSLTCPRISTPCSLHLRTRQSAGGNTAGPGVCTSSCQCCLWLGRESLRSRQATVPMTTWCTNQNANWHPHCCKTVSLWRPILSKQPQLTWFLR